MTSIFLNLAASDTFNKDQLPHTPVKAALLWIFLDIFSQRGCQHDHFHLYRLYEKKKKREREFQKLWWVFSLTKLTPVCFQLFQQTEKISIFYVCF